MPDDFGEGPVRRGRRDPNLAIEMEMTADEEGLNDAGTPAEAMHPTVYLGLSEGAIIAVKHTLNYSTDTGGEGWATFGVQDRVLPGEDEEGAFERIGSIVNARVLDLAADMDDRVGELMRDKAHRRISGRGARDQQG